MLTYNQIAAINLVIWNRTSHMTGDGYVRSFSLVLLELAMRHEREMKGTSAGDTDT